MTRHVALVNPFDPLPGSSVREGRYAAFARALAGAGHKVTWYSCGFSHTLKRPRDPEAVTAACRAAGFDAVLVPAPPYGRNVGLARLRSHAAVTRATLRRLGEQEPPPDVIVVSAPPPRLAAGVARLGRRRGARLVLDIQDLWPETFLRLWPRPLRWLNALAGMPEARAMRQAERLADTAVAVAEGYRRHFGRRRPDGHCEVLHLGVDFAEFDRNVASASPPQQLPQRFERWVLVGGMVGSGLHWPFMLELADRLRRACPRVGIAVAGTGPLAEALAGEAAARGLDNIAWLGYVPYPSYCALAARADLGLCHYRPDSFVFLPNRVFDYLAGGLDVVNTIAGELADLLVEHACGFTTADFDADAAAEYIAARIVARPGPQDRPAPRRRRDPGMARFDRPAIAARLVSIVEGLPPAPRDPRGARCP